MKIRKSAGNAATLREIAEKSGFSICTVSKALRGSCEIAADSRAKIVSISKALGYKPNAFLSRVMSGLKSRKKKSAEEIVALINISQTPDIFDVGSTFVHIAKGVRAECKALGYYVDTFWLGDKNLNQEKLFKIFKSRNIRGGIVCGITRGNRLPKAYEKIWKSFTFVASGLRTYKPPLDFTSADQYFIAYTAFKHAIKLGFKRPSIAISRFIDNLVDGRFVAGFLRAQLDTESRIPPFLYPQELNPDEGDFFKWIKSYKPDCILCLNIPKFYELKKSNAAFEKIGLVLLEKMNGSFSGMRQNNVLVGRAAVQKLHAKIQLQSQKSKIVSSILIEPKWELARKR